MQMAVESEKKWYSSEKIEMTLEVFESVVVPLQFLGIFITKEYGWSQVMYTYIVVAIAM